MTVDELLAQYTLPDDERKRLLIGNALLGLGSGLMQAKRGGELTNAGLGLFAGAQQGQNAVFDAQKGQVDKLKLKQMWQESEDKKAQQAAQAALTQRLTDAGNPTAGMPSLAPTNENAASIPKSYEIAMRQWQIATDAGDLKRAEEYRKAAEFLRVKYGLTPQTLMRDGKPVVAQMSEYGDIKEATGYSPKPEYQKVDTGKQTMFYDPLTGAQGGSFAMQTTPGQDQAHQQWQADYGLRKNADQRAAATANQAKEVKPQWDSTTGQFVYAPTKENPTGAAVTPAGYTPKVEKPSDEQLKTGGFVERMQFADKYISAIEKKGYSPGAGEASVQGLRGVPVIGGILGGTAATLQGWVEPQAAEYKNAKKAWIRAKLRKESGAVIGAEEEADEDRTFFPQPGDPLTVVAQKAALRKNTEQTMAKQSRGGFQGNARQDDPLGLR